MPKETIHPDVTEVIATNRAACKHEKMELRDRWVGGRAGMIGGQTLSKVWWCPSCKQDVRAWDPWQDDPTFKEIADGMQRGAAYLNSLGKEPLQSLTEKEIAEYENAMKDKGQLVLFK